MVFAEISFLSTVGFRLNIPVLIFRQYCFIFGIAGLNSVTKGSIFSCFLGFVFNAVLLLSNLISSRVFLVWVSVYPRSKRRFFEVFDLGQKFTFI